MTAFDTDVLSDLLAGQPAAVARLARVPAADRAVPAVAMAEVLRGWLAAVRAAEAGRGPVSLELGLRQLDRSVRGLAGFATLPYTPAADAQYRAWRAAKVRVGSQDLRIAAIAAAHGATLVTRNARDFAQVPGLALDVWT